MRAPLLAIALVAALSGACASVHSMTREDRVQASLALQEKPAGTVLTAGEIDKLDLDHTYVCETETRVGSHIPTYQCRTLRRVERERAAARGFVWDNAGEGGIHGCIPPEGPTSDPAKDLLANGRSKAVKTPPKAQEDSAEQDPRFPPL
ncbi:MAG TPA: hypothetical protein VFA20_32890 [Myxococcaceae bacterium]|nr:hypothetical protein [Myxococcaceae bacterium]